MPCYHPIPGWYAKRANADTGKRSIVFNLREGFKDKQAQVPCGQCIGCRLEYSRRWAVRCMHETKLHAESWFLTLTYRDDALKWTQNGEPTLCPRDVQLFLKRLRKAKGAGVRFFQCGEYGDLLGRPHHHMLVFNCSFPDKRWHKGEGETTLYSSKELEKLWGHGQCLIGTATFESAGYIARYTLKKVRGSGAESHYNGRVPEYLTMSRRPGIGAEWARRFHADWYPSDSMVVNGVSTKPPRFYDELVEKIRPGTIRRVKIKRKLQAEANPDNTGSRLVVREQVKRGAMGAITRSLEAES